MDELVGNELISKEIFESSVKNIEINDQILEKEKLNLEAIAFSLYKCVNKTSRNKK